MKSISTKYEQPHPVGLPDAGPASQRSSKLARNFFILLTAAVALTILVNIQQPLNNFIYSNFSSSNHSNTGGSNENLMIAVSPATIDSASTPETEYANLRVDSQAIAAIETNRVKMEMEKTALKHAAEIKAGQAFLKRNEMKNLEIMNELSQVTEMHEYHFQKSSSRIEKGGLERLDSSIQKYIDAPQSFTQIIVLGFTDSRGTKLKNVKLGLKRAESLKALLVKKGIPAEKITVASFGSELPIGSNDTNEGRFRNRRVELNVLGTTLSPPGATGS